MLIKILAVNNYHSGERFIKLRNCLEKTGAKVTVTDREGCSASYFGNFDGVALSGSPDMLSSLRVEERYSAEMESIRGGKTPILGICYGHQLIALAFGSQVVEDARPVLGFVKTEALVDDPLFAGLPRRMMLLESRHEIVKSLPDGFDIIARSTTSKIAAMKHRKLPLYGVQSHPERYNSTNPHGNKVVANFVSSLA